jgi:large subunit ribosomal protein L32
MPVPKRKRSRARRDSRFADKGITAQTVSGCKNCQAPVLSHQICLSCGFYKGAKVLSTKLDRKLKRAESSAARNRAAQQQAPEQTPAAE